MVQCDLAVLSTSNKLQPLPKAVVSSYSMFCSLNVPPDRQSLCASWTVLGHMDMAKLVLGCWLLPACVDVEQDYAGQGRQFP